mmetsp:Transcript_26311/g.61004  ORF Transcript_26311/g.61004 Transcript_26311/m.61004 type:complete len:98 (-) Transcript_26311:2720-3013(-)
MATWRALSSANHAQQEASSRMLGSSLALAKSALTEIQMTLHHKVLYCLASHVKRFSPEVLPYTQAQDTATNVCVHPVPFGIEVPRKQILLARSVRAA